jgi:hypothetical protein
MDHLARKLIIGPLLVAAVLALACSSSDNTNTGVATATTTSVASATTGAGGSGSATATRTATTAASATTTGTATRTATTTAGTQTGGVLTDCQYVQKVQDLIAQFESAFQKSADTLTSAAGSISNPDDAKAKLNQAIDGLDQQLGTLVSQFRALNVPPDIKPVNDELVAGFQDLRNKLPDARKAASAGTVAGFTQALQIIEQAGTDAANRFDQLEQKYPDVSKRLSNCG